ncbi:MAG: response regulator transcription factor [Actinobacteria bacterium]|nr:response regulator transcription factor [Actinomycetota bacterium]
MSTALSDHAVEPAQGAFAVLIVDDHELVHLGLRLLLSRQRWVSGLHCARNCTEAVELAARHRPPVAVVAVRMGEESSFAACEKVRAAAPATRILVAVEDQPVASLALVAAGAAGIVSKAWSAADISRTIWAVGSGRTGYATHVEGGVLLSEREQSVLSLIASGATNREIASVLHLAPDTIKQHASGLYRKLHVRNRAEAVLKAQRLGLLH